MKVLFITTTVRNENASVATEKGDLEGDEIQFGRLAKAMHALLLCRAISREKQIELRSNTMNLLSNLPIACYSELTIPMHVHVDSLVDGIDWSQKISLLRGDIKKVCIFVCFFFGKLCVFFYLDEGKRKENILWKT